MSNLCAQPAQRQMFGADVPAASNNTTLQQLSIQAGRRQCRIGMGLGAERNTPEWKLMEVYGKDLRKAVIRGEKHAFGMKESTKRWK